MSRSRLAHSFRLAGPLLVGAALALPGSARAAIFEDDEARRAIIDLRGRLEVQDRDTRRRLEDMNQQIAAQLGTRLADQMAALNARLDRLEQGSRGQLEVQNQLELIRQDVARLRGQLEVQTNELANTQRGQRDLYANLDGRLKSFERVEAQVDGKSVQISPEERRLFDGSLAQVRSGDFATAITGFQMLRVSFPDTTFNASALYWTGSAQFALKDHKAAISTLQSLLAKYPDHPRASDALLTIGLSQADGGDKKLARKTLETVREKYPDSQAAQVAKERLPQLKDGK